MQYRKVFTIADKTLKKGKEYIISVALIRFGVDMSEEILIKNCSPTLAGLKTGSLFNCRYACIEELKRSIIKFNKILAKKGLRIVPLLYRKNTALVYVYRPKKLKEDLSVGLARELLSLYGYPLDSLDKCLVCLAKKIQAGGEFPHEIGLFLGYPIGDVQGFIQNKACGCKLVGMWKVYGDEENAKTLFKRYKKCTDVYMSSYTKGNTIERLTVAV